MSFIQELKRRNVFRVGAAYAVISWVLLQIGETLAPALNLPDWVNSTLAFFLILGFPLALFFAWAFELTPEGIKKEKDVDRTQSITHVTGRKLDYTIIALMGIALVYFVWESRFSKEDVLPNPTASVENTVITADTANQAKSIAVLPFVNMSDDASNEYFSDGISEEILNALAKVTELKVAGRTSSFAFKGENIDLRQIGEALGVQHILEGSVRKFGNQVRITAQLIKVDDGFHLWSESYDRELDNVFAIQDEIASAILVQLKTRLLDGEASKATPVDTRAYELYLLARQRTYERTHSSLALAIELLDQVLDIDQQYAPAYALKGTATILIGEKNYGDLAHQLSRDQSKPLLEKALEIDPESPEALAGMGLWVSQYQRDDKSAITYYQRALDINPSLTNAGIWYATSLANLGEIREAMAIGEGLFEMDPLNPTVRNNLAVDYNNTGQADRSLALADRLAPVIPGNIGLAKIRGEAYQMKGEYALAVEQLQTAVEETEHHGPMERSLGAALAAIGEWQRVAEMNMPNLRALSLSYLDRTEEAFMLVEREVSENGPNALYFQLLVENNRHNELIDYVESRWLSLEDFDKAYPERDGYGTYMMGFIAQAYGLEGNDQRFDTAMRLFGEALDSQLDNGASNGYFFLSQAFHAILSGDRSAATDFLEQAFGSGVTFDPRQGKAWPAFSPLHGDTRYEQARSSMLEHLNGERLKLGLNPISA